MARSDVLTRFEEFQQEVVLETSDHALSTLTSMVTSGAIDLSPHFQRRDRWDSFKQSQLIESFVLNIPVPPIYLAEGQRGRYDVIDGKQRLTAISHYLSGEFMLRSLERFPDLNGRRFVELPPEVQGTLNFRPLRTVTLLRQSTDSAKYEVFHRLNSGGQVLNAQEIRNVLFRGPLNELIYTLSENAFLRRQLKIASDRAPAYKNMTDAEWVLRFFTMKSTWERFSGDYRQSMDDFMANHANEGPSFLRTAEATFHRSLEACEKVFGRNAFKRPERGGWRDQAIAGVYDAEMVAFAEISDGELLTAARRRKSVIDSVVSLFQENEDFDQATRQATNTPRRVRYRVTKMIEAIRRALV